MSKTQPQELRQKQNRITGSVWRNCYRIFKIVVVFAKPRQSLRLGDHNSKPSQFILRIVLLPNRFQFGIERSR